MWMENTGFLSSTPLAASSQDAYEYASYLHHGVVNGQLTSVGAQTFYAAMLASGTKRAYDDPNGSFIGMAASTEGGAPSSAHTISDSDNGSDCSDVTVRATGTIPDWMRVPPGVLLLLKDMCDQHGQYWTLFRKSMPDLDQPPMGTWVARNFMCKGVHFCSLRALLHQQATLRFSTANAHDNQWR